VPQPQTPQQQVPTLKPPLPQPQVPVREPIAVPQPQTPPQQVPTLQPPLPQPQVPVREPIAVPQPQIPPHQVPTLQPPLPVVKPQVPPTVTSVTPPHPITTQPPQVITPPSRPVTQPHTQPPVGHPGGTQTTGGPGPGHGIDWIVQLPGRQPPHALPVRVEPADGSTVHCVASGFGWRRQQRDDGSWQLIGVHAHLRTTDMLVRDIPANRHSHAGCVLEVVRRRAEH
jgi:hypothetical protein